MTNSATADVSLEVVRRMGQALWMCVGTALRPQDLRWAQGLFGPGGANDLYRSLEQFGALAGPNRILDPHGLARFLSSLIPSALSEKQVPRLVWTLPPVMSEGVDDNYCCAAVEAIDLASHNIWLVSPFLEARGVGRLLEALHRALARAVTVRVISHSTDSIVSGASVALEQLRREAVDVGGRLIVSSVKADAGLLVHSKLIVADTAMAVLGSANITEHGLNLNFEAGIVLNGDPVFEIVRMIERLHHSGLIELSFET